MKNQLLLRFKDSYATFILSVNILVARSLKPFTVKPYRQLIKCFFIPLMSGINNKLNG